MFFTQLEPGATPGNRRHLCRVEEGGSIFAISGVRGRSGGGLVAVGAGPAQLLKFARGDLIRLSFEEGLSAQVAVLIDDWLLRAGRALRRLAGIHGYRELELGRLHATSSEARGSESGRGLAGCAISAAARCSWTRFRCRCRSSRPGFP